METTYAYDALSQLTRVNCPHEGKTTAYAYDWGGNLLRKRIYALTKGDLPEEALQEIEYQYADANWKDKLTAYNGVAITYDAIGNPLHDGTWAYTWQYGRRLEKMECGSSETAAYAYNKDGLRIRKESSSRGITKYVLSGKQIIHMTREKAGALEAEMHFYYNERSKPTVCAYNGKRYGYVYNAHGDVMALIDLENGRHQVVTYTYDAWGKPIGCTGDLAGTLGKENPFRYRTYVYDEETGLYYLRSRYYNPEWGRFINADKLLTQNLFAYCENMPVKMVDADGMSQVHATHSADGGGSAKKKTASSGGSGSAVELVSTAEFREAYPTSQGAQIRHAETGATFDVWLSNSGIDKTYHIEAAPLNEAAAVAINAFIEEQGIPRTGTLWVGEPFHLIMSDGREFAVGVCLYGHLGRIDGGVPLQTATDESQAGKHRSNEPGYGKNGLPMGHFDINFYDSTGGGGAKGDGVSVRQAALDAMP